MTWPAGIETVALTFGGARRVDGVELPSVMRAELVAPGVKALTWKPTGTPMLNLAGEQAVAKGGEAAINLPVVDQHGWRDDLGLPVGGWAYKLTQTVGRFERVKYVQPRAGQGSIDFDKIPDVPPWGLPMMRPVRNLHPEPRPRSVSVGAWVQRWYGSGGNGTRAIESVGGVGGRPFWRKTWTAAPVSPEDSGLGYRAPVEPGKTYTALLRVRASRDLRILGSLGSPGNLGPRVDAMTAETGGASTTVAPTSPTRAVTIPANQWTVLRSTFTVPAGNTWIQVFPYVGSAGHGMGIWQPGDTLDAMDAMVVEGVYDGDYSDGSTPGWYWEGAAGASASAGWPYTLESIAGPPLADMTAGVVGGVELPLAPFEGRTMYTVYDALGTSTAFSGVSYLGPAGSSAATATGTMYFQTHSNAASEWAMRFDTKGGSFNRVVNQAGAKMLGRHVLAAGVDNGIANAWTRLDGGSRGRATLTPGEGMTNPRLFMPSAFPSYYRTHNVLAYRGSHDEATAARIMAWLANRYGVA